jgi:hypothetical protein
MVFNATFNNISVPSWRSDDLMCLEKGGGDLLCRWFCFMVFNATLNNISVILWRSVLLVEETGEPGENHRPAASHCKLYHMLY